MMDSGRIRENEQPGHREERGMINCKVMLFSLCCGRTLIYACITANMQRLDFVSKYTDMHLMVEYFQLVSFKAFTYF